MGTDLALTLGLLISGFSIPSILSAISDGRAPRASMVTILMGGGLILFAMTNKPGGYEVAEVPDVFLSTIGRLVH